MIQFPALQDTIFDRAIVAVRQYRAARGEPVDEPFFIPLELTGIRHIVAVGYGDAEAAKTYTVIHATERGLSVIDSALVRGIRSAGAAGAELLRRMLAEPRDDAYARAVQHVRAEVGDIVEVSSLRDHFYRVEGSRAGELCYALFSEREQISGFAFGPVVGRAERRFAAAPFFGAVPLDAPFQVIWGGPRATENHHFGSREQRYALDLEPPLGQSAMVLTMAAGHVVHVEDAYPDDDLLPTQASFARLGNNVVVRTDTREAIYAHLRQGSVRVHVGDRVRGGEIIGEVGNSGFSTRPHLHVHVRTVAERQGIPLLLRSGGTLREFVRGDTGEGTPPVTQLSTAQ